MSEDIKVTDGTILESLNGKVDLDGGNYRGSGLENRVKNSLLNKVLFDTKLSDHVLSFEESQGWALQGTYVYKEAVAGSRYGYPDFYNKCVEEKDLGVATETVLGENTITLYVNSNGHTFYDIADKEAIDTWYSTYGIAWYYGVDTENERVFLPRTKWFIQPSGEITEVNTANEAGLPTHTHTRGTMNITGSFNGEASGVSGAFSNNGAYQISGGHGVPTGYTTFDASRTWTGETSEPTNPIYGNSDTVQPPSINQLLYICVGNTNVESAVIDVVDVTTTENDTVPLFIGMYFDFTPNNVSWLKAGQQANSGGIYTFTYNELVKVLNGETKYGDLKVIDVADMEVGVDYSEYWKVNQEDMTFITPTAISNKALSGGVMGNGMTLGLTNGIYQYGLMGDSNANIIYEIKTYGESVGSDGGGGNLLRGSLGITPDSTKSGIIAEQSTSQLYFKVANAVQNLELLDVGEVMESLADKISRQDCKAYVTETYVNGASWYRVYSDGWCEQGGYASMNVTSITFLKPFVDTNYTLTGSIDQNVNSAPYWADFGFNRTATGFSLRMGLFSWQASGYIA